MKAMRLGWVLGLAALVAMGGPQLLQAPLATDLMRTATDKAKREKKGLMVGFHASWCGWCKKMEAVLARPEVKPVWEKHFVTLWLTVDEPAEKKALENPGAADLRRDNKGEGQGIPFFYFVDPATGKTIVNSIRPASEGDKGGNVGCPVEPFEIDFFLSMVKKARPNLANDDLQVLRAGFETIKKGG
ncbi:MAG: thioredoxin family protein [Armatimonadetes bacterium]|nr:MAG: thioredoxin family protein [Armatimonadota bacterium]